MGNLELGDVVRPVKCVVQNDTVWSGLCAFLGVELSLPHTWTDDAVVDSERAHRHFGNSDISTTAPDFPE